MQVVYSGAHASVVVDELDTNQVITRGTPVDVPDDLGARLIQQDTWSEATQAASAPSAASQAPSAPVTTTEAASAAPAAPSAPADSTKGGN